MACTLSIPVTLVGGCARGATSILEVAIDEASSLSDFQRHLAIGLGKSGKLLGEVRFRGNSLLSDNKVLQYAAANSRCPSSSTHVQQLLFVKLATGRIVTLVYR